MATTLKLEVPVLEERLREHYPDYQLGIIKVYKDIVNARIDEETVLAALDHVKDVILPDYGRRMRASPYSSPIPEMRYKVHTKQEPDTLYIALLYVPGFSAHGTLFQEFGDQHHNLVRLDALTEVVKVHNTPG